MGELKKLAAFMRHSEFRSGSATYLCFLTTNSTTCKSFLTAFIRSSKVGFESSQRKHLYNQFKLTIPEYATPIGRYLKSLLHCNLFTIIRSVGVTS